MCTKCVIPCFQILIFSNDLWRMLYFITLTFILNVTNFLLSICTDSKCPDLAIVLFGQRDTQPGISKNINIIEFNNDLASSDLILHPPTSLPEMLDSYDSTLRSTLDKHAPLITKLSKPRKPNPWCTPALLTLKSSRRHLERKYISTHSVQDYKILTLIAHAKRQFNAQLIQSSISNRRLL